MLPEDWFSILIVDLQVSVYKQRAIVVMATKARRDRKKSWPARKSYRLSIVVRLAENNQGDFSGEVRDADNPRVSG